MAGTKSKGKLWRVFVNQTSLDMKSILRKLFIMHPNSQIRVLCIRTNVSKSKLSENWTLFMLCLGEDTTSKQNTLLRTSSFFLHYCEYFMSDSRMLRVLSVSNHLACIIVLFSGWEPASLF